MHSLTLLRLHRLPGDETHRRALNKFLLSAAAFAAAAGTVVTFGATRRNASDPFLVHEWGTFTMFQGSNGSVLEGLHHEEESLPHFVHSITTGQSGQKTYAAPTPTPEPPSLLMRGVEAVLPTLIPAPVAAAAAPRKKFCGKGICVDEIRHVTTKMETPVLYFHTDRPRQVDVKVGFENGLLSQFYPAAKIEGYVPFSTDVIDLALIPRTSLSWSLDLVPHGDPSTRAFPEVFHAVEEGTSWELARDVRAAAVQHTAGTEEATRFPNESERYVFYRGLGRLDLPLFVEAQGEGRVVVKNTGVDLVPASFLLEMTPRGGRFVALGKLAANSETPGTWSGTALRPKDEVVRDLRERVKASLVAEGLHDDESGAMVKTWSRTWFGSEGTRLLYLVPRAVTDRVLPMTIDPVPEELVRVLVGRLEFLTPELEAAAETALVQRMSRGSKTQAKGSTRLARFGRFQEAVARRVLAKTANANARAAANSAIQHAIDS